MRVINLPETDTLSDDDYIVIDSEEGTPVKVPASILIKEDGNG